MKRDASSKFTKVVGAITLATLVAGLAACSATNVPYNPDYLVVANVKAIDCPAAEDDLKVVLGDLQSTAAFVETASSKYSNDILKLNEGITSLEPLSAALSNKIDECTATTSDASEDAPESESEIAELESSLTLDEALWGDLSWDYPDEYVTLIREHDYKTDSYDGDVFPRFVAGTLLDDKQDTESVRPPLVEKTAEQVIAIILSEPDVGAQAGSGLANMPPIVGGKTLLQLNPWLQEFADIKSVNEWADEVLNASDADRLVAAKKLVLVAMLFERVGFSGVATMQTSFNFHLVWKEDGGTLAINPRTPKAVPEFELNPSQYVGEFVVFSVTLKGQQGCWLQFGINVMDGRFAGFTCETPPPTGCTTDCGGTPPCTVDCNERKTLVIPETGTINPAPVKTTPPASPEPVDTDPVDVVDTNSTLPPVDPNKNSGTVSDD